MRLTTRLETKSEIELAMPKAENVKPSKPIANRIYTYVVQ